MGRHGSSGGGGRSLRAPFSSAPRASSSKPKVRKSKTDPSSAYTYLPSLPKRHRTSAQNLSLSRAEADLAQGEGRRRRNAEDDEDGDEPTSMRDKIAKLAMMIASEDPGTVAEDESEVDSDDAWDDDDEERWGDTFRELERGRKVGKGKAKDVVRRLKPLEVDLGSDEEEVGRERRKAARTEQQVNGISRNPEEDEEGEDEEEEEEVDEGEDDEDLDDDHLEDEDTAEPTTIFKPSLRALEDGSSEVDDGEDAEEDEEETADDIEEDDEDEDDDQGESDLELPSASEDEESNGDLNDLDAFVDSLTANESRKRPLQTESADEPRKRRLLPVVAGPSISDDPSSTLRASSKVDLTSLINSNPALSSASALLKKDIKSTSILKSGVLPAPLPTVVQERLDREAAYEKTKEEGQKWSGVMKRIKEAEHLSFPLQAQDRGGVKSQGEMLATFKPENKLESAVQNLLNAANLTDANMTAHEDQALQGQELTMEEIAERRAALRHQRELMFRAEARAKRVAKIKSKTFRKLARKRKAKLAEADSVDEDEEREKLERLRAKERATLRHGAHSKWARSIEDHGGEVEDRRRAKEEMLDLKERLKRKIAGDDGESASEESDADEDDDVDVAKAKAFDQLAGLDAKEPEAGTKDKLLNMAFMKKAQEREMRRAKEDEADLRREIEMFGQETDSAEESGNEEEDTEVRAPVVKMGEGRMVFTGPKPTTDSALAPLPVPMTERIAQAASKSAPARAPSPELFPVDNPWMVASSSAGPSRKRNTASGPVDKASRQQKKLDKASRDAADEDVLITTDMPAKTAKPTKAGKLAAADSGSEDEDELMPVGRNGLKAFKQRDLVAEAFAGDNVVEEFEREKEAQIKADAPGVEDTSLPGWGSWGGKGTKKRATNPRFLVQTPGIEPTQRKDFSRSNVIITEKKDKKAHQFLAKDLPYPYTSVAQYEASFSAPIGSEWNARKAHQRETMPRVVKKPGAIIEPVRRLF